MGSRNLYLLQIVVVAFQKVESNWDMILKPKKSLALAQSNNSLNRSANSAAFIRETKILCC
jgi:hypothetical protein